MIQLLNNKKKQKKNSMTSEMENGSVSNVLCFMQSNICRWRENLPTFFFYVKMFCTNYKSLGFSSLYKFKASAYTLWRIRCMSVSYTAPFVRNIFVGGGAEFMKQINALIFYVSVIGDVIKFWRNTKIYLDAEWNVA